ncbi:MAG TPA: hypothetical protein VF054_11030 [Micromonosporaceae bacterium]
MGLSVYGDPDALDRLADRIRALATEVRDLAADHVRVGEAAHWVSTAADAYRERLRQDAANAGRAADELERAAALLRAHAQTVRDAVGRIVRAEQETVGWLKRHAGDLIDKVEGAI